MTTYEGVVIEYLRADPAMFVRPQCCIQLHPGSLKTCDEHWYCDAVAVRFREPSTVFLCEVTFAKTPVALFNRLRAWREHWPGSGAALARENALPESWPVQPWVFVRGDRRAFVARKLGELLQPAFGGPVRCQSRWSPALKMSRHGGTTRRSCFPPRCDGRQ